VVVSGSGESETSEDFAFWGYLFGMLVIWIGLSLMENRGELGKAFYCFINLGLMLISVLLERRVFTWC